jgi:glucose/arabinose dehydrogenase/putative cell wall-binding protein
MSPTNLPAGRRLGAVVAAACVLAAGLSLAGTPPAARATVTPLITLKQQPGNYSRPILVTNDGSRLFVVQQTGQVYVAGSTPALFLNLAGQVAYDGGERGLLGLAFAPDFATSKLFYVYYTRTSDGSLQISRFTDTGNPTTTKGTEATILNIPHPGHPNHNGGMLAFGPDGDLYIGTGDGGGGGDPGSGCGNAQNTGVLLGKILRISPHTSGTGYDIPPGNPTAATTRDEVWSWGLRNPWRWSFDRATDDLWIGDVGQNAYEEIDRRSAPDAGKAVNFGWPYYEGFHAPNFHGCSAPSAYAAPLLEHGHSDGSCAIVGGYVYRGSAYPDLTGRYFFSDNCRGTIWDVAATASSPATPEALLDTHLNVSSFGEDRDGELYVADLSGGHIYKVTSNVQRVYGPDRYATSASVAQFGGYGTGGTVYVASGANFPDALAGAAVAGKDDAPLLLVNPTGIAVPVLTRLNALLPSRVVILGSTGSVSAGVETALRHLTSAPTVVRYGGTDRYDTAAMLVDPARAQGTPNYSSPVDGVFIAAGTTFPDALSAAPVAGAKGWPLLLVQPNAVPLPVLTALEHLNPQSIVILGSTGSVSQAVEDRLRLAFLGNDPSKVLRLGGSDRYDTSRRIAQFYFHNSGSGLLPGMPDNSALPRPGPVYAATGTVFADALSGAPLAARDDAPLLLMAPTSVPAVMVGEVRDQLVPQRIVMFGSSASLSYSVGAQLGEYCQP